MNLSQIYDYYSREDVQEALVSFGSNREIAGVFRNGNFSSRPNVLLHNSDVPAMVKQGVIEFHCSLEKWTQPMGIKSDNYDSLRSGWDIILDLDSKDFDFGKIASRIFLDALKAHGVKASIKYTGGKGFHIGIPWKAIPDRIDYTETKKMFPELPRKIATYLKDYVWNDLEKALLNKYSVEELSEKADVPMGKLFSDDGLNPFLVVDVDPILISSRHLFRMPYSLNKKSFLVSLPIDPGNIEHFEKDNASPDGLKIERKFMEDSETNQAKMLIAEAIDWWSLRNREEEKRTARHFVIKEAVSKKYFPPCIQNILNGLSDGRKRSLLIMFNFLRTVKWKWEDIENLLMEWNRKNNPPLRESFIRSQVRWHKNRKKEILPPNCFHEGWYTDFGVCKPDQTCKKIKNPVSYPFRKMKKRI